LPGSLFGALGDSTKRVLNCMGYQNAPMFLGIATTFIHFLLCYVITLLLEFGVYGPAISLSISNLIGLVLLSIYSKNIKESIVKETFSSPSKSIFNMKGLIEFMKIGLPSIGMICLEWWSFEIMTIIAA
jgi:MATE family multidrug resistance protein